MTDPQNDMFGDHMIDMCAKHSILECDQKAFMRCECGLTETHSGPCTCRYCKGAFFPVDSPVYDGTLEGERLRDEAIDQIEGHNRDWAAECKEYMLKLYEARCKTSVINCWVNGDDATEWLDREGYKGDNRLVGAVFRSGWEKVGTTKSRLPKRHARPISCWRPKP